SQLAGAVTEYYREHKLWGFSIQSPLQIIVPMKTALDRLSEIAIAGLLEEMISMFATSAAQTDKLIQTVSVWEEERANPASFPLQQMADCCKANYSTAQHLADLLERLQPIVMDHIHSQNDASSPGSE
ncbi:MAG: hypothetical protein AAF787_21865, partial [Chloroflexota bacterium]